MHVFTAETRRNEIERRLQDGQSVNATALAKEFSISEDAVRRDLRAMAAEGKCKRVYGGALPLSPQGGSFRQRILSDVHEKRTLALAALPIIADAKTIFLDSGTTNLTLAREIPPDPRLTVATNSIAIAATLLDRKYCKVIMVGGEIDREAGAAVGPTSIREAERLNFDLCFLGACAASVSLGVGTFGQADAEFKRTLVANSARVAVVVTMDKVETRAPFQVVALSSLDHVILEHGMSEDVVAAFSSAGPDVVLAKP